MRLSRICHIQILILLIGFPNVAFASWPFSSNTGTRKVSDSARSAGVSYCQDAREVVEDYCRNEESRRDFRVVGSLVKCFMNEAGREVVWKSGSDVDELKGTEVAIKDDVLKFVDELCEDSSSNRVSNIFTWFNGDIDLSRVVNSLHEAVEQVSLGGQRVQNLQQDVQTISKSMAASIRGLREVKSAFFRANSSLFPDEGDIERLHDELWVIMQDLVQTFNSYTLPISEASRNFKNRAMGMKSFEKVAVKIKSIVRSWSVSRDLTEKLLIEVKKNKGMRSRILHPWLRERGENRSPENALQQRNSIVKTVSQVVGESMKSNAGYARAAQKDFGSSIKQFLMLLYDGVEMLSTAYLRFAFSKLVLHVIASPVSPMWLFLIFTGLVHLLGGVLILARICLQIGELTSSVLGLVTKFVRYLGSSKGTQPKRLRSLEKKIVERLKESLSEEKERIRVQEAIESVSDREISASFNKLQSLELHLHKASRELQELNERMNAHPDCE